jgi:hypothetical protein
VSDAESLCSNNISDSDKLKPVRRGLTRPTYAEIGSRPAARHERARVIEPTFATVQPRTKVTNGPG